jgi:hypothetical protein
MSGRTKATAHVELHRAMREALAAAPAADDGATPYDKLLRAAESGRFEALVRKARLARPLAMITPQEREAALRASGRWLVEKAAPRPVIKPPPPVSAEPPRELTPNEQYLAEHCRWSPRGPHHDPRSRTPSFCKVDYDPLAEEGEE